MDETECVPDGASFPEGENVPDGESVREGENVPDGESVRDEENVPDGESVREEENVVDDESLWEEDDVPEEGGMEESGGVTGTLEGEEDLEDKDKKEPLEAEAADEKQVKSVKQPDLKRERGVKLCIRRLPPEMTKKEFVKIFEPLAAFNYLTINNPDKEWVDGRSVAWINFVNEEDAALFMAKFNGYSWMESRGTTYICSVDLSPEPTVPRFVRYNKRRGGLAASEHFQQFLQKLEDKKTGKNEETVSVEKMLQEIESKAEKNKEPENTPLLDHLLSKKKDRSPEKRESKRRDRRDKENRGDLDEKGSRREKRRERDKKREKERKERRGREKLEKDALAKGMTITYSKSGKVTRWSANSSPLLKKDGPSSSRSLESVDNVGGNGNPTTKSEKKTVARPPRERKNGPDAGDMQRETGAGDKQRGTDAGDRKRGSEGGDRKRGSEAGDRKRGSEGGERKRGSEGGDRKRGSEGGDRKRGSEGGERKRGSEAGEKKRSSEAGGDGIDNPKGSSENKAETKETKDEKERRRRARPDMPIYRPGSFRTGGGSKREVAAAKTKPASASSAKASDKS